MADVQLEHGFLRLANDLDEALTYAPFSGAQAKIVRCLVRLSFGWGRQTVRVAVSEIAERCNERYSGAFRRSLSALIAEKVVREIEPQSGRRAALYAVNKNYEEWGKYSVAARTLERLFRTRFPSNDIALKDAGSPPPQGHTTADEPTELVCPPEGTQRDEEAETLVRPPEGILPIVVCPPEGTQDARKSNNGETLQRRKDSTTKDKEIKATATSRARPLERTNEGTAEPEPPNEHAEIRDYAVRLSTAANAGITARWGEQPSPLNYATGLQLAEDLRRAGIPLEIARHAIASVCAASKNDRPPYTLSYFKGAILDAYRDAEQKAFNAADPATVGLRPGEKRGGQPRAIAAIVNADTRAAEHKLRARHDDERRHAAIEWGKDPAHHAAYAEIVAEATAKYEAIITTAWGQKARDAAVVLACAELAQFPAFEKWAAQHDVTERNAHESAQPANEFA
jgi:phage replication O-like protein O